MIKQWAVNASPLIIVAKVSLLSLLPRLAEEIIIPEGVADEVSRGPADDPARKWLEGDGLGWIRAVGELDPTVAAWDLGLGESHVLSWAALRPGCEVIVDDLAARNCAFSLGIPVRGTFGVILLAKKRGLLPSIKPVIRQLIDAQIRVEERLLKTVLDLAGEP